MTSPQQSATVYLQALLSQWHLSELWPDVQGMLTNGDTSEMIPLKLRDTTAYKKRFAGNAARVRAGLSALSEAQYLSTEDALKGVVRRYVGSGTYDSKENIDQWIGKDVAPQELNDRMTSYRDNFMNQSQEVRDAWASHGLTPADAIKGVSDPAVTETSLRRRLSSYALGGAAVNAFHNGDDLNQDRLGQLVDAGVTTTQAQRSFGDIAARQEHEAALARASGTTLSHDEQVSSELLNDQQAAQKRLKVLGGEKARFDGNYLGGQNASSVLAGGSY